MNMGCIESFKTYIFERQNLLKSSTFEGKKIWNYKFWRLLYWGFQLWRIQLSRTTIFKSLTLKATTLEDYHSEKYNILKSSILKVFIFLVLEILWSFSFEGKSFWIFQCLKTTTFKDFICRTLHFWRLLLSNSTHFEDYTVLKSLTFKD